MTERLLSPEARTKIAQNKNVLKVGEFKITYSPDFKVQAVRANLLEGKLPQLIFLDAGFDLELIGQETPKHCLKKWRVVFKQRGEQGLRDDQRGRGNMGRPSQRDLTIEEKLRRAEARVRFLKQENELLKKLDRLERAWLNDQRRSTH